MAQFKADADTLEQHGYLHQQIAQFYRDLHDQTQGQGTTIVNSFNNTGHGDYAAQYQQWLSPQSFGQLLDEAHTHDAWAQYFFNLANEVRRLEGQLSGPPHHAPGRGPIAQ